MKTEQHDSKPIDGGDRDRPNLNTPVNKLVDQSKEVKYRLDQIILDLQVKRQHLTRHLQDMPRRVKDSECEKRVNMRQQNHSERRKATGSVEKGVHMVKFAMTES
jgi:hypothetical protein